MYDTLSVMTENKKGERERIYATEADRKRARGMGEKLNIGGRKCSVVKNIVHCMTKTQYKQILIVYLKMNLLKIYFKKQNEGE